MELQSADRWNRNTFLVCGKLSQLTLGGGWVCRRCFVHDAPRFSSSTARNRGACSVSSSGEEQTPSGRWSS
uniref:Uncharacterized protein n=1 Tax=Triticum urartu TaxID=4572 RepID=A0A8R7U981_TRIUA